MENNSTHNEPSVEFVITAPESYSAELAYRAGARMTLGALTQLLSQAKSSITISAPFIQKGQALDRGPLADSLYAAVKRGVNVDIVSTGSGVQSLNIKALRAIATGKIRVYRPIANIINDRKLGSHAKFCIADGLHAYIGSANLTGAGLSDNLEMGFLVNGQLAQQVEQFWRFLIEIGFFVETEI